MSYALSFYAAFCLRPALRSLAPAFRMLFDSLANIIRLYIRFIKIYTLERGERQNINLTLLFGKLLMKRERGDFLTMRDEI